MRVEKLHVKNDADESSRQKQIVADKRRKDDPEETREHAEDGDHKSASLRKCAVSKKTPQGRLGHPYRYRIPFSAVFLFYGTARA